MKQTVEEFLIECNKKDGYSIDKDCLIETLRGGEKVYTGENDTHRWYIKRDVVRKVNNYFIKYTDYLITGDACMEDMDLEYDLSSAKFVDRKTREVIEVYYE